MTIFFVHPIEQPAMLICRTTDESRTELLGLLQMPCRPETHKYALRYLQRHACTCPFLYRLQTQCERCRVLALLKQATP